MCCSGFIVHIPISKAVDVFVIVVYDDKKKLTPLLLSDCIILKTRRYGTVNSSPRENTSRNRGGKGNQKRVGNHSSAGSNNSGKYAA